MDGQIPTKALSENPVPPPISSSEKPIGKKGFLFKIIFIVTLIVILFGVLNYFNILNLPQLSPNKSKAPIQKQFTPFVPTVDSAKKELIEALPKILNPSLIPDSTDVIITQNNQNAQGFTGIWTVNESTASALFQVSPDSKGINQLHLSFKKNQTTPPSITTAPTLSSTYLSVVPKGKWECKPLNPSIANSITYCENFWEENGIKSRVVVQGLFTQGPALVNKSPIISISYLQQSR